MRIAALVTPGRFTRALLGVIGMLLAASLVGNLRFALSQRAAGALG